MRPSGRGDDAAVRARAWRNASHAAVCDVIEPWAHGTVVRATRHPSYYDFNVVRVEEETEMSADALAAWSDEALAGLAHRRLDFDLVAAAESLRGEFEAKGWSATRLLWMRRDPVPVSGPTTAVEEVPYDTAHDLRLSWYREEFPHQDPAGYHEEAREVALSRGVQVLAMRENGEPVAFAQLEHDGAGAEITQVFVHPDHRGAGRGTAMTRAAIKAAGEIQDLWIVADDEGRPKELYARLGFRPAWKTVEFLRMP